MNKAYKTRIAASKAALDNEMRAFAEHHLDTKTPIHVASLLCERFPAIDRSYAATLAGVTD